MEQNIKQFQEMGYDRNVAMFSPSGLLLQVEYAEKAVKLGSDILAMRTKEGLVFIGDRKIKSKLLVKNSFKKIFLIDDHLIMGTAGLMSDGRRLIEQARLIAQEHMVKYQMPIDTLNIVRDLADIQQYYSQNGGLRPFGVSLLIGGIEDNKPKLYLTTPSGVFMEYLAKGIGANDQKIDEYLEKEYNPKLSNKAAIKLGLKIFKDILEDNFNLERFDVTEFTLDKKFKRLNLDELKKIF